MIIALQIISILFFTSLIHEVGHALACRFCGIPVIELMVWSGSEKIRLQFGRFAIGWFPWGGYVATPFIYDAVVDFFITLCGPLANIVACMITLFLPHCFDAFGRINLAMGVYALLPIGKQKDGFRLLLIIKKWYNFRKHCR